MKENKLKSFEYYDVCIIGASIAGNYLSFLLSDSNLRIAVIEKHESIGYPFQCTGIVSKKLTNIISILKDILLNCFDISDFHLIIYF
ncbi:MAG: NAD(P)-binding protein [Promethearchaeia archaeon]|nr:MAG: hypothetical protein EU551_04650 [Candidatus Lokiarchaeota archaeon]